MLSLSLTSHHQCNIGLTSCSKSIIIHHTHCSHSHPASTPFFLSFFLSQTEMAVMMLATNEMSMSGEEE
jgi:hypothetical protein